jgi:hypothetical protein
LATAGAIRTDGSKIGTRTQYTGAEAFAILACGECAIEGPVLLLHRRHEGAGAVVVEALQALEERVACLARLRVGGVAGLAGFGEGLLRVGQLLEAEDGGERVEQLRRALVEHRAELVVGEDRLAEDERDVVGTLMSEAHDVEG